MPKKYSVKQITTSFIAIRPSANADVKNSDESIIINGKTAKIRRQKLEEKQLARFFKQ